MSQSGYFLAVFRIDTSQKEMSTSVLEICGIEQKLLKIVRKHQHRTVFVTLLL